MTTLWKEEWNGYLNRRSACDSFRTSGWRHFRHKSHDRRHSVASVQTLEVRRFRENQLCDRCCGSELVSCVNLLQQQHSQITSELTSSANLLSPAQNTTRRDTKKMLACAQKIDGTRLTNKRTKKKIENHEKKGSPEKKKRNRSTVLSFLLLNKSGLDAEMS